MAKKTKKENTEVAPVTNCDRLTNAELATQQSIQNCILTIRGQQVMLDRDLAVLYGVETFNLNKAVKRNIERFPKDFMFQLSKDEFEDLKSQIATSNLIFQNGISRLQCESESYKEKDNLIFQNGTSSWGGTRKLPYAFTENGIAMLSGVLRSQTAVEVNIRIMRAFTAMRKFINTNAQMFQKLEVIESHQLSLQQHVEEHDRQFEMVFKRLEEQETVIPNQRIFYNGQIFDAYVFVNDLIRSAKERIVLIDNYVDDTVLERLDKRETGVKATIYTRKISRQFQLDIAAHNSQQPPIEVLTTDKPHDRFLIIDNEMYLIGASIKDLGKKIFGFTKMEEPANELLKRLED